MAAPPPSPLDGNQVLQHAFDDANGRLRTDATLVASDVTVDVELTADNDAVRIEDPDTGAHVKVEADGSINVNVDDIEIDISHTTDSIRLGDGTNYITSTPAPGSKNGLDVNVLNNIDISGNVDALLVGINEYTYNEISIASGATMTVISQLFPTDYKLRKVRGSGENIGVFSVKFDATGVDKYRTTYTDFNVILDYETGIFIPAGTTVIVEVMNVSNTPSLFSTQILYSAK